jgi:serine phosphatase RsbU (regulator of sigma subunit)
MSIPLRDTSFHEELRNFRELAEPLEPSSGAIPRLPGLEIHGRTLALNGQLGGDHVIYIDFNRRYDLERRIARAESDGREAVASTLRQCRSRGGILVADVSGHRLTDAVIAAMLHQAFLLGVYYELDRFGEITTKLFEHINQRFYQTTTVNKYMTMIYGEVAIGGAFRFVSAGHPEPLVFSGELGRFRPLSDRRMVSFPPLGMFPSAADLDELVPAGVLGYKERYEVNEIDPLAPGDLLLLYTDGLSEHGGGAYLSQGLEPCLAASGALTAREIVDRVELDLRAFATPEDDISLVVVKRTAANEA